MDAQKSALEVWLDFIKAFLWPSIVLIALVIFRQQVRLLLDRLSTFKLGDAELAFQSPSSDAKAPTGKTAVELSTIGLGGFFTEDGIRNILRDTGSVESSEKVIRAFQIFSTQKQRTWLAFSDRKIFCILDDETTRTSGRLIQWALPKDQATPIVARRHNVSTGLLDIGERKNWLYSIALFPTSQSLETEVNRALNAT